MEFSIKPKVNRVTFYWAVPFLILSFPFLYGNPFNFEPSTFVGIVFILTVGFISILFMSLFKPWLMTVSIKKNIIRQVTDFGGEIKINILKINFNMTYHDDSGLNIAPESGESLFLSSLLFSDEDLYKLVAYINKLNS